MLPLAAVFSSIAEAAGGVTVTPRSTTAAEMPITETGRTELPVRRDSPIRQTP